MTVKLNFPITLEMLELAIENLKNAPLPRFEDQPKPILSPLEYAEAKKLGLV